MFNFYSTKKLLGMGRVRERLVFNDILTPLKGSEMIKKLAALLIAGCASAQGPASVTGIFDGQLRNAESEIISLVEAMPAGKMNFAPTNGQFKGVRTFAEQAKHV